MKSIRTIVAGVATLTEGDPVLLLALDLARRSDAKLHLVHAYDLPQLFTMSPGVEMAFPEGFERYAAQVQERLEAVVRRYPGGDEAGCHAVAGSPALALCGEAVRLGADLVLVGVGHGGRILGTTAQRVLRSARVPVLLAREAMHRSPHRVLLTTELSELSAEVHERALDVLEGLYGLEFMELRSLLAVHSGALPPPLPGEALRRAARVELDRFLRRRRARPLRVEPAVRFGGAAEAIVSEATEWNADLLVVGTHGRRGLPRLWLGSVAEACIRDAPCSVLAVPPVRAARGTEPGRPLVENPAGAVAAAV